MSCHDAVMSRLFTTTRIRLKTASREETRAELKGAEKESDGDRVGGRDED